MGVKSLGAFDKLSAASRIGVATAVSDAALRAAVDPFHLASTGSATALATAQATAVPPSGATGAAASPCACYLEQASQFALETRGAPFTEAEYAALAAQCGAGLKETLAAAGVDLERCKPWYMRHKTWLYAGIGVIGVAGVSLLLGGSK